MDNPKNMDYLQHALELHQASSDALHKSRVELNAAAFAASGLAKGDRLRVNYLGNDAFMEVTDVTVLLRRPFSDEPTEAVIRVHGVRLNKNGARSKTWRGIVCSLSDVIEVVSKAVQP